jgi:RNA polymerase sigma factor (sigma-70 family)
MPISHQYGAVEQLRRALLRRDGGGLSDAQLLDCFLQQQDAAAFEALVRRHGPMVLGVCRRVLCHYHDAEDAFQATFLVLARKAATIVRREKVASWLYGVAYQTALKCRGVAAKRRSREKQVLEMPEPEATPSDRWSDLLPLLDQELSRLPDKYRRPIVLCDLEGLTRKQAARQLGWQEGTVSSRLSRGRLQLAHRLRRYGLVVSGGALTTALAEGASAKVPLSLLNSTTKAAVLIVVSPTATVTTPAAVLMKEVLKTMFLTKLKAVVATAFVLVALGAGGLVYRASGEGAPSGTKPLSEIEALRKENELLKLNLQVVLEKVRAQEAELHALKGRSEAKGKDHLDAFERKKIVADDLIQQDVAGGRDAARMLEVFAIITPDLAQQIEMALGALKSQPNDKEAQRRATEALEMALQAIKEKAVEQRGPRGDLLKPGPDGAPRP